MDVLVIIAIAFVICGFIGFLFLLKGTAKAKAIKHYESIRDKLTVREQKELEVKIDEDYGGLRGFDIGNIIGGFVAIFIGTSLLGPISEQLSIATNSTLMNATTVADQQAAQMLTQIAQAMPIFFALGILFIAVGIVAKGMHRDDIV